MKLKYQTINTKIKNNRKRKIMTKKILVMHKQNKNFSKERKLNKHHLYGRRNAATK
jgi:hypothetical protein